MCQQLVYAQMHINRAVWAMNDECNGKEYDPADNKGLSRDQYIALQIKEARAALKKADQEYPHQLSLLELCGED
jgi:hypothetical protein